MICIEGKVKKNSKVVGIGYEITYEYGEDKPDITEEKLTTLYLKENSSIFTKGDYLFGIDDVAYTWTVII